MPRMDNTNQIMEEEFNYKFNYDDPGDTAPIDLCADCASMFLDVDADVFHPPYEELYPPYVCELCGNDLDEADNGYV